MNTSAIPGEWCLPPDDSLTFCPLESNAKSKPGNFCEANICYECRRSFLMCDCKSCLKCGSSFMKYVGTNIVKGRSHCRMCSSPVCLTCIITAKGLEKVCTRCHLKQKEDEISTEKALSAIGEAKFGDIPHGIQNFSKLKSQDKKNSVLFEAAKKGHDHVVVTLINMGCDVNVLDGNCNTPLYYAVEGGFLQCVVLLLEKGASIKVVNNVGWTPLHAVAWKGLTDSHVDVTELLLEMGADPFALSNVGETAADVAERYNAKIKVMQILRAAEVETAIQELNNKASSIVSTCTNPKERRFGRLILSVLHFIRDTNGSILQESTLVKSKAFELIVPDEYLPKTHSLDRGIKDKQKLCDKCSGLLPSSDKDMKVLINPLASKKVGKLSTNTKIEDLSQRPKKSSLEGEEKFERLNKEKQEWEERCRKLVISIAATNKEHQKLVDNLNHDLERLKEEKAAEILKCEAAYSNKISKIRQETDLALRESANRLQECEEERGDLIHLNKALKLTWVPDEMIAECQHNKCRVPFSKVNRKHHCRCCGRVFCDNCSKQKSPLQILGYQKPVRVCNTCFALVDDVVKEEDLRCDSSGS